MAILLRGVGRYLLLASVVLIALFVLSQVAQLVALASTLSPAFGTVTAIILLLVLGGTVAVPVLGLLRLDPPLAPPEDPTGPEHEAFVKRYLDVCRRNPLLADRRLDTEEDLVEALKHLETEAEKVVTATASRVFLGTAVSQFGVLDAVVTGFTQLSMVWRIAHVFQRRPSLRQLGYLYANVLATAAAASQLDKVDIAQHLRPVLTSVLGQSVAALPGVSAASGFLTNVLFQGTVNAFLTLRIGMVAIAYSRATVRPERRSVWQGAVAKSARLLAKTVGSGTAKVTKAVVTAAGRSVAGAATSVAGAVVEGGKQVGGAVATAAGTLGSVATQAGSAVTSPVRQLLKRKQEEDPT